MLLKIIFAKQDKLDNHFKSNPEVLKSYCFDKKVIALFVEIAEFLNEIEVFKYWKMNKRFVPKKILEEFVDGLHFIASIAVELKFSPFAIKWIKKDIDAIKLIKKILLNLSDILKEEGISEKNFQEFVKNYFQLIINLDFSEEDVLTAFTNKNNLNFRRANTNY